MDALPLARKLGLAEPFEILAAGGITVLSPPVSNETDPVWCRTVVELDGDVITSIRSDKLGARDEIEAHFARVRRETRAGLGAVRRLLTALGSMIGLTAFGLVTGVQLLDGSINAQELLMSALGGGVSGGAMVGVRWLRARLLRVIVPPLARYVMKRSVGVLPLGDERIDRPGDGPNSIQ